MSSAREPGGREAPGRLVEGLGLAGLVLVGHALGGGSATVLGLVLLAGATLAVTTLARHLPQRSGVGDVVLLVLAQAAGHLALALGGGEVAHPAGGRMLAGHAVSTLAVAALVRHGRRCWSRAGQLLARALRVWEVLVLPPAAVPAWCLRSVRDDDRRPVVTAGKSAIARRGPPRAGCAAYA